MEIRPVYHDAPRRIDGHFVVYFLAFLMERKLEHVLKVGLDGNEDKDVTDSTALPCLSNFLFCSLGSVFSLKLLPNCFAVLN